MKCSACLSIHNCTCIRSVSCHYIMDLKRIKAFCSLDGETQRRSEGSACTKLAMLSGMSFSLRVLHDPSLLTLRTTCEFRMTLQDTTMHAPSPPSAAHALLLIAMVLKINAPLGSQPVVHHRVPTFTHYHASSPLLGCLKATTSGWGQPEGKPYSLLIFDTSF